MIFFAITSDKRRKYASDMARQCIEQGKCREEAGGILPSLLNMFDGALNALPKNFPKKYRDAFENNFLAALMSFVRGTNITPEQFVRNMEEVSKSISQIAHIIRDRQRREEFIRVSGNALNSTLKAATKMNIDVSSFSATPLPGQEEQPFPPESPSLEETEQPSPPESHGLEETEQLSGADLEERIRNLAIKGAMEAIKELPNQISGLPNDLAQALKEHADINTAKFTKMLIDFTNRLIAGAGNDFRDYYNKYGRGSGAQTSIESSVYSDFVQIGRAFMYQALDYACVYTSDSLEDPNKKAEYKKYSEQFDKSERGIWDSLAEGHAKNLIKTAKILSEKICRDTWTSSSVEERAKEKSHKTINTRLYNKKGYNSLYDKFIGYMKTLSPFAAWQAMLQSYSNPGQIENGGLDRLEKVWLQAAKQASTNKNAAQFVKNFNREINLPAINGIAKSLLDDAENSYDEDKNPERFIEYLMQQIKSAGGQVTSEEEIGLQLETEEKKKGKIGPTNAPIPSSGGGPGTSAFALGIVILLYYKNNIEKKEGIRDEERIQLNQPEETIQLNPPQDSSSGEGESEETIQSNPPQPKSPATPSSLAVRGPAVSGE